MITGDVESQIGRIWDRDSLAQDHAGEEERYTLVLPNPPFAGSLDYEHTARDLLQIVKTKKTEHGTGPSLSPGNSGVRLSSSLQPSASTG